MSDLDAAGLGQMAMRCNLLSEAQLQDALIELESRDAPAEALARILQRKGFLTAYQVGKLLRGESDGFYMGGYRLLYKIASGSFGRVFRADNPTTGEVVAIKVLRRRWLEDTHKVELFEREGRMGLSLIHPNIVQVKAVNRDPATGGYYIIMEFVEGGNLRDILAIRKRLELDEALRMLEEAASGLAYALSRGLTHRDIKQTNILVNTQGVVKLVDFGLAAIAKGSDFEDDSGEIDRTVDYAGLERATGAKQGDPRSDIFFLGTVFFEMVTGNRLLSWTKDRHARLARQRFEIDTKVRKEAGIELPPQVFSLIERSVSYDPNNRFQTPTQLEEAARSVRLALSGEDEGRSSRIVGPVTVFIIEGHQRLQDTFREKFNRWGMKPLISIDPGRAVQSFATNPYHALIMDAGTAGEAGLVAFDKVMMSAELNGMPFGGILILSEDQAHWGSRIRSRDNAAVLVRPVTMKQIKDKLIELVPAVQEALTGVGD